MSGSLKVKINVSLKEKEMIASSGNIELPLKEDWRHSVHLITGQEGLNPTADCFGCSGIYTFDFKREDGQSNSLDNTLYIILAGNFIEREVIY